MDTKKARLVCLINSVRQIKDNRNKPLTFINFDDGTGAMDGIITSDVLENCHSILKESSILVLKGAIEIDDYRSKEFGETMFRMRIKEVNLIEDELSLRINSITLHPENNSEKESEAIVELGEEYLLKPSQENLNLLRGIFGSNSIKI